MSLLHPTKPTKTEDKPKTFDNPSVVKSHKAKTVHSPLVPAKVQKFIQSIRALPSWQKWLIVVVVIALPAGIILGTMIFKYWSKKK